MAGVVDLYLVVTLVVFWLAHVYSQVLAKWIQDRHTPTWTLIKSEMAFEWPMVSAPLVPAVILLVPGPMGCRQYIDLLDNLREIPDLSDLQMKHQLIYEFHWRAYECAGKGTNWVHPIP